MNDDNSTHPLPTLKLSVILGKKKKRAKEEEEEDAGRRLFAAL